ncbi:MAG: hypothetical protein IPH23_04425 [Gammaproteobacteria bacterium]|nr:hypothetical protein [Gammaproteobacteria bacterium]
MLLWWTGSRISTRPAVRMQAPGDRGTRYQSRSRFFVCHFIGDPVMPGCLGSRCPLATDRILSPARQRRSRPRARLGEFMFFGQVLPTAGKVTYRLDISRMG